MPKPNPRAFVCHAGEDKVFARDLGVRLRENGVDAFVDEWEILPGDKLVDKIFREGVPRADVFIIILSKASVAKPWVKEELDAALVLRIETGMKIIPVRTEDCAVPVALRSTARLSIDPSREYTEEFKRLLAAIYEIRQKPPIGSPPQELTRARRVSELTMGEEKVLEYVVRNQTDEGGNYIEAVEIGRALPDMAIEDINDAVDVLSNRGIVRLLRHIGTHPYRFGAAMLTPLGYHQYAPVFLGIDTTKDCDEVLALAASSRGEYLSGDKLAESLSLVPIRINSAIEVLESKGLVEVLKGIGTSPYSFHAITATADGRRTAQQSPERSRYTPPVVTATISQQPQTATPSKDLGDVKTGNGYWGSPRLQEYTEELEAAVHQAVQESNVENSRRKLVGEPQLPEDWLDNRIQTLRNEVHKRYPPWIESAAPTEEDRRIADRDRMIRALHAKGLSDRKIAKQLGIPKRVVQKVLTPDEESFFGEGL
jgi:DNA-binding NarL/FixJ family response regulator